MLRGFLRSFSSLVGTGDARSSWASILTFVAVVLLAFLPGTRAEAQAAHFSGALITAGSGFTAPHGVAVDSKGDVFVVNSGFGGKVYEIVAVNGLVSTSSSVIEVGSGFSYPLGVAVDSKGDVFVADGFNGGNSHIYEVVADSSGNVSSSSQVNPLASIDSAAFSSVALDASGNVYAVRSSGEDLYVLYATGGVVPSNSTPVLLATGFSDPSGVTVDVNGNIYVSDYYHNAVEEIPAGSTFPVAISSSNYLPAPSGGWGGPTGVTLDANGDVFVSTDTAQSVYEIVASSGAVSSSSTVKTVTSTIGSLQGLAISTSGNIYLAIPNSSTITEDFVSAVNFGAVPVNTKSSTYTLNFTFDTDGTTINAPAVLTQGATGKDFADATTGSCTQIHGTTQPYALGATCTVDVTLKPASAGTRLGAVELTDTGGNVLATAYVYGVGKGSEVAIDPGTASALSFTGSGSNPQGVATDSAGNVYYSLASGDEVYSTPGGPFATTPGSGLDGTGQLAVDGAGNVYVANGNNSIQEFVGGATTPITVVGGLSEPQGVAVDGAGNLYIGDTASGRVLFQPAGGGTPTVLVSDHVFPMQSPAAIALDAAGNVYFVDIGTASIDEIPAGNGTTFRVAGGPSSGIQPTGIAVDAAGDILYTDMGLKEVIEIPVSGSNIVLASGFTTPVGVALDPSGNFYVADSSSTTGILAFTRSAAATHTLNFANSPMGTPSGDSPQTLTVGNIGNVALNLPAPSSGYNPSIATGFTLGSGAGSDCPLVPSGAAAGTLNPGTYCLLPVSFVPPSVASFNGSTLTINDDTLNTPSPYATQNITLNGTGTLIPQTINFTNGLPASALWDGVNLTYTVSATGGGSGNAVTFSLDAATTTGAATLSGSALTITGPGTVIIDASQAGNADYAAGSAQQQITVTADTPTTISAISGSGQSASEGAAFTNPLLAEVTGTTGLPMEGVTVTFTVPSSGASATLSSYTAATDVNGEVSVTATANLTAGAYNVTAAVSGVSTSATFALTNLPPATFTVTSLVDDATGTAGNCTDQSQSGAVLDASCNLRDAIAAAAAAGTTRGTPTINFAPAPCTAYTGSTCTSSPTMTIAAPGDYNMTTGGMLNVNATMNIVGPGANLLSLDGGGTVKVLSTYNGTIAISGLTITNGNAGSSGAGGIDNSGTLTVTNSTLSNNSSADGGGIDNFGTLTLNNSTLSNNVSTYNATGCIYNIGTLVVNNSTLYANPSGTYQCIENQSPGTLTMTNSIVAGSYSGVGIYNGNSTAGAVTLANSLVNFLGGHTYTDNSGNIISPYPGVVSLGYYGGTTETMPPAPGSPAICAGTLANATAAGLTTDQRGNPRSTTAYSTTACVDAGAVQSAYSLSFVISPSNPQTINTTLPTSTVQLNDLNPATGLSAPIAIPGVSIAVALNSGTLTGATSQSTDATGLASFGGLTVSPSETSDFLIASATAGPYTITANSGHFDVDLYSQTITILQALPSTAIYNGVSLNLPTAAMSTSGGTVTFSIDSTSTLGIASIAPDGTLTISGTGTVVVDANSPPTGNYGAAPQVQQTITVTPDTPATIAVYSGNRQSARVGSAFTNNLTAQVTDAGGSSVYGVTVTFAVPSSGASATLSTYTAITDVNGQVSVAATANGTAGAYQVTASYPGSGFATFGLTNLPPPTYTVTTLTDDASGTPGNCTDQSQTGATLDSGCNLRDAIAAAAAVSTSTTTPIVNFAGALTSSATTANPADYNITKGGTLNIGANMNIVGPAANLLKIDGGGSDQVFNITAGTVAISGLTITNGSAGTYINGGGINNAGTLTVSNCTISNNSANSSNEGGGIYNAQNSTMMVLNSTIMGNTTQIYGGGIANDGTMTLTNTTLTANSAPSAANGYGGGIYNNLGTMTVINSTISGNTAQVDDAGIFGNGVTLTNDLITDVVDATPGSGTVTTSATNLSSLGYYGGTTETMMPLPGSPAMCAASAGNIPSGITTDQRGNPRSTTAYGSTCVDAGAVQTAYSLSFAPSPSASQFTNSAFTPTPAVQLNDLNPATGHPAPIALAGAKITVSLDGGTLSAASTTQVDTDATGKAVFDALIVPTVSSNDFLIAAAPSYGSNAITVNSGTFSVVSPIDLSPTAGALPAGIVGTAYSLQFMASGGTAPYTYSATGLPPGLMLSTTGQLSGTPTTAAGSPYSVSVTVTDSAANTVTQHYTLAIKAIPEIGVTLTSGSNPTAPGVPVTFTATVSGTGTAFAGTVSFSDGANPITGCKTQSVTGGEASCGTNTSDGPMTLGSHSITATYSGDTNYGIVTSVPFVETVADFTITAQSATLTVDPGSPAVYSFTVAPQSPATSFPAAINFTYTSVPALPTGWTVKFSTNPIPALSGSTPVTMTIDTTQTTSAVRTGAGGPNGRGGSLASRLAPFSLALLLLPFAGKLRKSGKRFHRMISVLLLLGASLAAAAVVSGCGSTSGFFGQTPQNYTVTVTAATASGTLSHKSTVTLTVE